jgi:hypothetical protein
MIHSRRTFLRVLIAVPLAPMVRLQPWRSGYLANLAHAMTHAMRGLFSCAETVALQYRASRFSASAFEWYFDPPKSALYAAYRRRFLLPK